MSVHLPPPPEDELSAEIQQSLAQLPPLNLFPVLANAPASFKEFLDMGSSILFRSEFDPRKREIAILRVAHVTDSEYEWQQHVALARRVGLGDDEIEAIRSQDPVTSLGDETALLCQVADEISRDVRLSDEALGRIMDRYGNRGAAELILCCAWFNLVSRFLESARVPLEEA